MEGFMDYYTRLYPYERLVVVSEELRSLREKREAHERSIRAVKGYFLLSLLMFLLPVWVFLRTKSLDKKIKQATRDLELINLKIEIGKANSSETLETLSPERSVLPFQRAPLFSERRS